MEIIEFYLQDNQEYWLSKIKKCDWVAGKFLFEIIKENKLKELLGNNTKVLLLTDERELISFCTLSEIDDIADTKLTPWIGFVYTFPNYRGNRYIGKLICYAEEVAKLQGFTNVYISTDQIAIYEKYGYSFFQYMKDRNGEDSRVYVKHL